MSCVRTFIIFSALGLWVIYVLQITNLESLPSMCRYMVFMSQTCLLLQEVIISLTLQTAKHVYSPTPSFKDNSQKFGNGKLGYSFKSMSRSS